MIGSGSAFKSFSMLLYWKKKKKKLFLIEKLLKSFMTCIQTGPDNILACVHWMILGKKDAS